MPAYSELTRRLGFEYNGMVLHEYYFGNLRRAAGGVPARDAAFRGAAQASFGSYEAWKTDFVGVGKMRGVGWAICYHDPVNGRLSNHWITLHEGTSRVHAHPGHGRVGARVPARLLPAERPKCIDAFMANVDWQAVDARLHGAIRPVHTTGTGRSGPRMTTEIITLPARSIRRATRRATRNVPKAGFTL
jgi:Fe-Mn family superoxide dismutase